MWRTACATLIWATLVSCEKAAPPAPPPPSALVKTPPSPFAQIPSADARDGADLPDVPRYPGSVLSIHDTTRGRTVIYYYSRGTEQEVADWFARTLTGGGWSDVGDRDFRKFDRILSIRIVQGPAGYAPETVQSVLTHEGP